MTQEKCKCGGKVLPLMQNLETGRDIMGCMKCGKRWLGKKFKHEKTSQKIYKQIFNEKTFNLNNERKNLRKHIKKTMPDIYKEVNKVLKYVEEQDEFFTKKLKEKLMHIMVRDDDASIIEMEIDKLIGEKLKGGKKS